MRHHFPAILLLSTLFACQAFAETSTTPKTALCSWTQEGASWNLDRTMRIYHAQGEKEMTFARAMAGQALIQSQIQKSVRDKWGKEVERAVARAIGNDTLEDDQAAAEKVDGDRATITFKEDTNLPVLYMARINGEWKIDVAAMMHGLGEQVAASQQFLHQSTTILKTTMNDLNAGKFKQSAELVGYLKTEFEKLNASQ